MSSSVFVPKIRPEHIVAFGDAIFAFAITLMTLSIDVPDLPPNLTEAELLSKLYEVYPQVESYIISFAVISIFWVLYHQVFNSDFQGHIVHTNNDALLGAGNQWVNGNFKVAFFFVFITLCVLYCVRFAATDGIFYRIERNREEW